MKLMRRRDCIKLAFCAGIGATLIRNSAGSSKTLLMAEPSQLPVPEWAKQGSFVLMGLDGGPLEAEKGRMTRWDGFAKGDPRGIYEAVRDFYRPENVEIPKTGGANCVFITWTNGFSKLTESEVQWAAAIPFIKVCLKNGIHVLAYISAANMFWADYNERVPESSKWIEQGPDGYVRHYGGHLPRAMANLRSPEWRAENKRAIDAALDAGCEGFWFDNLFGWHGKALFSDFMRDMQAHAAKRKGELVWHNNINTGILNWGQIGNMVGCEDGKKAESKAEADPPLVGNLGLYSFVSGLTEGWRSAIVEYYGNNISGPTQQLMTAESWMWQIGKTWFPVDRALQAQWHNRDTEAWKVLEAMGKYNWHQLKYREYFRRGESLASVGVLGHPGGSGDTREEQKRTESGQGDHLRLLDKLGGWNVQYEVLFADRLRSEALRHFAVLVMPDPEHLPPGTDEALSEFGKMGRSLILPEGIKVEFVGKRVELPVKAFRADGSPWLLRDAMLQHQAVAQITVKAPRSVVWRAVRQGSRVLVHLANYRMQPEEPFEVAFSGPAKSAEMLIPEEGEPRKLRLQRSDGRALVSLPPFPIHALVAFYT